MQESGPALLERADSIYYRAADSQGALAVLEPLLDGASSASSDLRYEALWRAALIHTGLGVLAEASRGHAPLYARGEEYARRALELRPDGIEARYWLIAMQGRRAILGAGAREASELALSVRDGARAILARDPSHAGAHNAIGRLYYEVLTLPTVHRLVGRLLAGRSVIGEANWRDAEASLRRAVELDPGMILFRVDLARLLIERKRGNEARPELERAIATPDRHPADRAFKEEARRLLAGI